MSLDNTIIIKILSLIKPINDTQRKVIKPQTNCKFAVNSKPAAVFSNFIEFI